ncbi:hypothetical protein HX837_06025, partial [Marine Group I thaumarchaeote]|nr:hypothetical protein [Marine Group I thaumarchaeote]
ILHDSQIMLSLRIPLFTPKSIGIGAGEFSPLELADRKTPIRKAILKNLICLYLS